MKLDTSWPRDPRLDPFRDAVWELRRKGRVEAYVTSRVIPVRGTLQFWEKHELVWYRVNWVDGHRDHPLEDRGPAWRVVSGLEQGSFTDDSDLAERVFEARPVTGPERDRLWRQYGPSSA